MYSNYKNLIFDLGNVIVEIDYDATYQALAPLFKDGIDYQNLKMKVDALTYQYEQGLISTDLFINKLLKQMRPNVHAKMVIDAWNAMLLDIPASRLQLLDKLSEHYRIIFLSNTNLLHIDWVDQYLLRKHNIAGFNDISADLFYSHEVQDRKPNLSIFQTILSSAEIAAPETLFFDDNLKNVAAALSVGIHGVHSPPEIEIIDQTKILLE